MLLEKMTISKRIIFGYVVFLSIFLLLMIYSIAKNVLSLNDAQTLDNYNKADILSNDALSFYQSARVSARDIYLTKTYSDTTYNNVISNLEKSIDYLNNNFMSVAGNFITADHKRLVNELAEGISEYKNSIEMVHSYDLEKVKIEGELTSIGGELVVLFGQAASAIRDDVARQVESIDSISQVLSALTPIYDFQETVDVFWAARLAIRNILFLEDISEYDNILGYFETIHEGLTKYEPMFRESSQVDYDQIIAYLKDYSDHVDIYRELILKAKERDDVLMSLIASNSSNSVKASEITLQNLNGAVSNIVASSVNGLIAVIVVAIVCFIINISIAAAIINSITKVLKKTVGDLSTATENITSASGQLTTSANSLAQDSSEQAAAIQETSSTMNETASMIDQNTQNTRVATNLAQNSINASISGVEQANKLIDFMEKLNYSSDKINRVIATINTIASQTTILALNASVEAVRAGEAGRSFSVVAEEVRDLARQSTEAAESTSSIIEETIYLAKMGVENSKEVGSSMNAMKEDAEKTADLISKISVASEEQSKGVQQINIVMTQMEKTTQSTAAVSEESASAANELQNQALTLQEITQRIQALVGESGMM